jgi:hypothetical protein
MTDDDRDDDRDDDADEARPDQPFGWLADPYRGAPIGSRYSDD